MLRQDHNALQNIPQQDSPHTFALKRLIHRQTRQPCSGGGIVIRFGHLFWQLIPFHVRDHQRKKADDLVRGGIIHQHKGAGGVLRRLLSGLLLQKDIQGRMGAAIKRLSVMMFGKRFNAQHASALGVWQRPASVFRSGAGDFRSDPTNADSLLPSGSRDAYRDCF